MRLNWFRRTTYQSDLKLNDAAFLFDRVYFSQWWNKYYNYENLDRQLAGAETLSLSMESIDLICSQQKCDQFR